MNKNKKKQHKRREEDEEEDDYDQNEDVYENDGFIVNDDEVSEEIGSEVHDDEDDLADLESESELSGAGGKKKKKKALKKVGGKIEPDYMDDLFEDNRKVEVSKNRIKNNLELSLNEAEAEETNLNKNISKKNVSKKVKQSDLDDRDMILLRKELTDDKETMKKNEFLVQLDFPERHLAKLSIKELELLNNQIKNKEMEHLLTPHSSEINAEVDFIFDKLKNSLQSYKKETSNPSQIKEKIKNIIKEVRENQFELPYVITYCKYIYDPEFLPEEVWLIFNLSTEWEKMKETKARLKSELIYLKKIGIENVDQVEKNYVDKARYMQELKYVENYINYYKNIYSEEISKAKIKSNVHNENGLIMNLDEDNQSDEEDKDKKHIRPLKQFVIPKSSIKKVIELGKTFYLAPWNFYHNLDLIRNTGDYSKIIRPNEPYLDPNEQTVNYLDDYYKQNIEAIKASILFISDEILVYPSLKMLFFNKFKNITKISTKPTELGLRELDVFHPSFPVKRIHNKPANTFTKELFMEILNAEKEGHITYSIDINEEEKEKFREEMLKCYSEGNNKKWKITRDEVIKETFLKLIPMFKKELIEWLTDQSETYILEKCGTNFRELLMTPAYKKAPENKNILIYDEYPNVCSIMYDSEKNVVFLVLVNQNGQIVDAKSFYFLTTPLELQPRMVNQNNNAFDAQFGGAANVPQLTQPNLSQCEFYNESNGESEFSLLKKMISEKFQPDIFVISANHIKSKIIKDNITFLLKDIHPNIQIPVVYGNCNVPYIFMMTPTLHSGLENYNSFIKQAASLARYKQNPLGEILNLWTEDTNTNKCLSLKLHHLQKKVSPLKIMERLRLEAVRVVNLVGLDFYKIYKHEHLKKLLNFCCGLGPNKANSLITYIVNNEKGGNIGLACRSELGLLLNVKVAENASGFIKLKVPVCDTTRKSLSSSNVINYLDLTRLHPNQYGITKGMIECGLDDKDKFYNGHKLNDNELIKIVLLNPSKIQDVVVEKGKVDSKQNEIIKFAKEELSDPFKDIRDAGTCEENDELKVFKLMTADNPIDVGSIVLVKSMKIGKFSVICKLENDVEGILGRNDYTDNMVNPEEVEETFKKIYPKNSYFYARVKLIRKDNFKVELTTKPSRLADNKEEFSKLSLDSCFKPEEIDLKNAFYEEAINNSKKVQIKRNINHKNFKNINYKQCIEALKNKEIGEFLFRPSSSNSNCLTLSWVFYHNIISHVVIKEEDKAKGANIGSKLVISTDTYSSLYEVVDRYIAPCKELITKAMANRKFLTFSSFEEMESKLKDDKQKDPTLVHYLFTVNEAFPQFIILSYVHRGSQIIKEFIKIKPKGLFFHNHYFHDLNDISKFFKENFSTEEYRNYVKNIKPPGEENMMNLMNMNNIGSNYISKNNLTSDKSDYIGNKRYKSPYNAF